MIRPSALRPRRKPLACAIAASLALLAGGSAAQVDEVQLRLLTQFELPLRWDNVEAGRPYWTRGVQPAWRGTEGLHAVRLAPGESVTVRVPAGESLRVRALDDAAKLALTAVEALTVAFSNGTGLYAGRGPRHSTDGLDWLVDAPDAAPQAGPQLARVSLAAGHGEAVELALFVSRREPLGRIAPYRRLHDLPGKALDVHQQKDSRPLHYWAIEAQTPASVEVEGPARFALRLRLRYPASEAASAQHWRVAATLDKQPLATLEFATGAESTWAVEIDGRASVVSREKEGYFEVPAGRHRLTLASSAPVIARLLSQADPDYLVPALNAPDTTAAEARAEIANEAPLALRLSAWGDAGKDGAAIVAARERVSPAAVQAAALQLVRDNRHREGGSVGAAAMREVAALRRDDPTLRSEAGEYALHTFYRDLLPRDKRQPGPLRHAWFLAPRLLADGEDGRGTVLAGQHADELPGSLASGRFLPLGGGETDAHAYDLPERFAPSSLRIAVHADDVASDATVFVQYDDAPPVPLTLAPYPELPGAAFVPSGGEAALRLQQERFRDEHGEHRDDAPGYGTGTLSGAFSRRHLPGPLVAARLAELPLPSGVRQVRVWRGGAHGQPLWVALAYRASKPFQLTERAWLEAVRTLRGGPEDETGAIASFLAALGPPADLPSPSDAEADSHWQPLARRLRAQAAQFAAGIAPIDIAADRRRAAPATQTLREAESLAARGQWLGALEAWSAALASPVATEREQAFAGRITALRRLGEDYIAERLLRQRMLHDADPAARRGARDMLIALYREGGDLDAEQATRAAALLRGNVHEGGEREATELVAALVSNLLDNGEPDLALMAGLLLPRRERPLETMLHAAHAQQWWAVFDELVGDLSDPARQAFWRAQRALGEGRLTDAEAQFARAGSEGAAFAAHLARARDIHAALRADATAAERALPDWADWQASHPGPHRWQDAAHLATDFAGAQALHSIDRDVGFTAFRAEPERPLRLRVAGPAKLRIEARPLHRADSADRIDGWLRVRGAGREWLAPITSNAAAPALQLVGRPQTAAGRAVVQEIEVGPGWHDFAADGGDRPLLVRVAIDEAALPLPLLPRLTPDTAVARAAGAGVDLQDPLRWPAPCIDCSLLLDVHPGEPPRRLRLARNLIDANPATLADTTPPPLPAATGPTDSANEAALRAAGDWQTLLAWPAERSDAALRERVASLAWLAEHQPERQHAALALAEDILHAHPTVPGLSALVARIARDAVWTPLDSVQASAGLRSREVAGWDPESPALRVRRALLAPASTDERLLSGANRLVVSTQDTTPTRIEVTLKAEDAGALPPQAMTALLQIDEAAPVPFVLEPGRTTARRIALPAGAHTLRVWIAQPLADQFLRVRLTEPGRPAFADRTERFYHVATRAEPLRVAIDGPAWLRIDEWVDGRSESRYQRIEAGWQEIILPPAAGRTESLYRLHLRSLDPGRPRSEPRTYNAAPQPVAPPAVTIADRPTGTGIAFDDHFPLGGQEDGTRSLSLARRERLYGFEDSTSSATNRLPAGPRARVRIDRYFDWVNAALGGDPRSPALKRVLDRFVLGRLTAAQTGPFAPSLERIARRLGIRRAAAEDAEEHERFTEFAATHRYFAESWNTHYRSDLLVREREGGGPTLGLRGAASTAPAWTHWNFHVEGSAFAQSPANNDYLESSWGLRASATHLFAFTPRLTMQPRISLFWRGQSLGANRFFAAGRIDQDIYSPYRDHHPRGLEVAKTLTWRPWLDTELYAGAGVTTNPDMNPLKSPDHLSGRLGWRQLLGPLRFDANWDGRQYFEDSHRADDSTGGALNLEVGWEHWLPRRERLELGLTLRRDLARDRNLFGLELTWHFGNGRGYRDFRPGEIDFRDLRERRAPQAHNNRMRDEP
ncbi:hypothetical protein AzCIB_0194 [Azoarcus sp. CIB]|uniref:hypothetical protein n=1 Tax=Aromatoleum sp. (strain CIB) TaxID=198107 RepID=UPI00067B7EB2|nr:hypothetical protein [Azoarcus sp. CIB]AKU10099.1 hypothetical protein AzCIB_0194 [Azoarcus sp. CIB]